MTLKINLRSIAYLFVMLLSLAPALLVNTLAGYLPFLALFLCGVLSLLQLLLLKNRLEYKIVADESAIVRGEQIPFGVEITNKSPLPVVYLEAEFFVSGLDGGDSHVYPLGITMSPREKRVFSLSADFPHIGVYQIGISRLVMHDLLGNLRAVGKSGESRRIDIQPRVLPVDKLQVSTVHNVENERSLAPSPLSGMDYTGVRDYAYGDPIKTIQWKLSAHAGSLMTKQMESYTNTGATILLDFGVPDYDGETRLNMLDGIVETGVAVGNYAVRSGMDYELMYAAPDGEIRRCTPTSFWDVRAWLPEFRLQPWDANEKTAQIMRESSGGLHSQSNVLLCTARLTDEMVSALIGLRQAGKNVVVFYLVPDAIYDEERRERLAPLKRLQYARINCIAASGAQEMVR